MNARRAFLLAGLVLAAVGAGGVAVTYGAFSGSTSNPGGSFSAKRVFPGTRTAAAWSVSDASTATATDVSDPLAYQDARSTTTTAWATTFASNRYLDFDYQASSPAGVAVSGITFSLRLLPTTSTDSICWYAETRVRSTDTLIAAHGSSGSPLYCETGTTFTTRTVSLTELATSDQLNDLRVRVYGRNTVAARASKVDLATVGATMLSATTTRYGDDLVDAAGGSPATTSWSLAAAGGTTYATGNNWKNAYSATRYISFSIDSLGIPAGAVITGATLQFAYGSPSGSSISWFCDVIAGGSTIATHGSSSAPISSTTTSRTDAVSLPEVDTVAEANALTIKAYLWAAANNKPSSHDLVRLDVSWYLD